MSNYVFIDDEYYLKEEAKVSVFDHGFLYGDGIFEGIRAYNGLVFKLDEHIDRLYRSAQYIRLDIPYTAEDVKRKIIETLKKNNLTNAYIRLVVSRGIGDLGLDPDKCSKPSMIIITDSIKLYPEEFYTQGLEIATVSTRRNIPSAINPRAKTLNYLNNILAKIEGKMAGVVEALMLNYNGYVAECTGDNIFIVKDGALYTPPFHQGVLKGVTRQVVIELAQKNNIEVKEVPFTRFEIYTSNECFLTGTAAEIVPVVKIDKRTIKDGTPGPVTRLLRNEFLELVKIDGTPIV